MMHYVPPNDEAEHFTDDMVRKCPCSPVIRVDAYNNVVCFHRPYDMRHLIEQAEQIRIFTSIKLWEKVNQMLIIIPVKSIPFESGETVTMPQSSDRKPPEQEQEEMA